MGSLSANFVDVLIVGAGPAGLALANWFHKSKIRVLLVDKRAHPTLCGQAEGLKSTTVEIFESFGIGSQIWAEAHRLEEIAIWGHSEGVHGIRREQVMQDKVQELGKPRECMLQQSRCEHHMAHNLLQSKNVTLLRNIRPSSINIDSKDMLTSEAYPVSVQLSRMEIGSEDHQINVGTIRAKYVVGCDGARSWMRKALNVKLEGDLTDSVFGVMDFIPKTNFPDIRKVCYLRASNGTILLVPRSNREVRMYIPVESGSELSDPKDITLDIILEAARKIISPYNLDIATCSWWSAYRVGQRVGDHFTTHDSRAFLAGDAVHTHSPKAGQGMNTSVQDVNNLGWKLRLVLEGKADPCILDTYESERRPVAQDLIAFDRGYLKLFSASSNSFDDEFAKASRFTTGMSIRYSLSNIVQMPRGLGDLGPSLLKLDLVPGKRLADVQLVLQVDGTTTRIHQRLHASGQFRILVFAGDISQPPLFDRLRKVGTQLADDSYPLGDLIKGSDPAQVEVLLIHCADRDKVELLSLPEVFRPWNEEYGYDYWRVFADVESAHEGHGRAYERLEVDRLKGRMVIVRPDGYIGVVADVDDVESARMYFDRFMRVVV
ncbi:hypothetical protein EJ05DRAFT_527240 [Pseudovirgaria hyperparasitica]|uniref:Phenol 2-monooxygenase n=1 Tax=Pseudovirgaria hyperparasitica TaxID=470096 RepID=A0A6A6WB81_9PEZI|nr:uncharacterized protein EJ05DRAFT_527240 [Pseudovirgaria hyperparasitica]KAF2759096.1 hypothetical protein EJ05DRAFT_527240 [Pseudovirgaria hyperparasitica]